MASIGASSVHWPRGDSGSLPRCLLQVGHRQVSLQSPTVGHGALGELDFRELATNPTRDHADTGVPKRCQSLLKKEHAWAWRRPW